MNFKSLIKASVLSLSLVAFSTTLIPAKAQAFLLIMGSVGATPADGPWGPGNNTTALQTFSLVSLCIVTLPICLLDQSADSQNSLSAQELIANGYSEQDIQTIQNDQLHLTQRLAVKNTRFVVTVEDTKASITSQIKSVYPEVSQTYLGFAAAAAGLK